MFFGFLDSHPLLACRNRQLGFKSMVNYATQLFASDELQLKEDDKIGMGNRRFVFQHPHHEEFCIKVARASHIRAELDKRGFIYRNMPTHWRDDNWLEARAYQQKPLQSDNPNLWRHIPRLHGWQATNIGPGLVFDYYRSNDGSPAPNLRQVLENEGLTSTVERAIQRLNAFIHAQGIWMRHPGPPNIVLGADGDLKLIDCLGTYNMPLMHLIPAMRKRRAKGHEAYLARAVANLTK